MLGVSRGGGVHSMASGRKCASMVEMRGTARGLLHGTCRRGFSRDRVGPARKKRSRLKPLPQKQKQKQKRTSTKAQVCRRAKRPALAYRRLLRCCFTRYIAASARVMASSALHAPGGTAMTPMLAPG